MHARARRRRIRRTVVVSCLMLAVGAFGIPSADASEESSAGAATAVALAIGAYINRQKRLWQAEAAEDAAPSPTERRLSGGRSG
jgi:hypothetical protein